jgi:hypothetical protein
MGTTVGIEHRMEKFRFKKTAKGRERRDAAT